MAHSTIKTVRSVQKIKDIWVTEIEDADGNVLTGVGRDFKVGEPVLTFFDDRFNRPKFHRPGTRYPKGQGLH